MHYKDKHNAPACTKTSFPSSAAVIMSCWNGLKLDLPNTLRRGKSMSMLLFFPEHVEGIMPKDLNIEISEN